MGKLVVNGANLSPKGVKASVQLPIVLGYGVCAFFALFSKGAKKQKEILGLMVNHPHIPLKRLSEVKAKTLVIVGEKDMIKDAHTKKIAAGIDGAGLAVIARGDHFIAAKMPEAYNKEVLDFFEVLDKVENGEKNGRS